MKLIDLMTQYTKNPLGLEDSHPVFSWRWEVDEGEISRFQSAWRIQAAGSLV